MGKRERQAQQLLGMRRISKGPVVTHPIAMDWYLTNWFEKAVFVLGTLALIYSLCRITFQGFW